MKSIQLKTGSMFKTPDGTGYPVIKTLGQGSFGKVFSSCDNKIIKYMQIKGNITEKDLLTEVTIQQKLSEKEQDICPKIYDFGKIKDNKDEYIIVMEQCEGTARDFLYSSKATEDDFLDYFEQLATILQKLQKYEFNHRDLKSDNVMYKTVNGKKKYLLIDFGFSCATFDGKKYAGTLYFEETDECFKKTRDLAQLVFEALSLGMHFSNIKTFIQLVLTFKLPDGKTCEMTKGCMPFFNGAWKGTYDFLNMDNIENPNTTPEGLLKAVAAYRQGGLQACKAGFVVNPINDQCVPIPGPPAPQAVQVAKSPVQHVANPSIINISSSKSEGISTYIRNKISAHKKSLKKRSSAKRISTKKATKTKTKTAKNCPPGKVMNPKTRRCVDAKGMVGKKLVAKECPPGKIINPKTGRCINAKGALPNIPGIIGEVA